MTRKEAMAEIYVSRSELIHKIFNDFEKDSRELRDKLAKAQKYIVDLENQLKNKQNRWMNK